MGGAKQLQLLQELHALAGAGVWASVGTLCGLLPGWIPGPEATVVDLCLSGSMGPGLGSRVAAQGSGWAATWSGGACSGMGLCLGTSVKWGVCGGTGLWLDSSTEQGSGGM